MADSGLLIGWNRVAPGRDHTAVELWTEMQHYLRRLHAEGLIVGFEPVILGAYGGIFLARLSTGRPPCPKCRLPDHWTAKLSAVGRDISKW